MQVYSWEFAGRSRGRAGGLGGTGSALPFTTSFPNTEAPVSLGGIMTQGGTNGLDWRNTNSKPGYSYGSSVSTGFDDCICSPQGYPGLSTTKNYIKGVVRRIAFSPAGNPEIELFAMMGISANSAVGLECNFAWSGGLQPVRWLGGVGSFSTSNFGTVGSWPGGALSHGDAIMLRSEVVSGKAVLHLDLNSTQDQVVITDNGGGQTSGAPGWGFFALSGTNSDMENWGWQSIEWGNW